MSQELLLFCNPTLSLSTDSYDNQLATLDAYLTAAARVEWGGQGERGGVQGQVRSNKAKRVDSKLPLAGINNKTSKNKALKKQGEKEEKGEAEQQLKTIPEKQRKTVGERVRDSERDRDREREAGKKMSLTILSPENRKEAKTAGSVCVYIVWVYRGVCVRGCIGVRVRVYAMWCACISPHTHVFFSASA